MSFTAKRRNCAKRRDNTGHDFKDVVDVAFVIFSASSRVIPLIISVSAEEEAIALAQPNVWNYASAILPSLSSLNVSFNASPHASAPTLPTPSASSSTPTLRGLRKWSRTFQNSSTWSCPCYVCHGHEL